MMILEAGIKIFSGVCCENFGINGFGYFCKITANHDELVVAVELEGRGGFRDHAKNGSRIFN
jgi:hypothetical protein